MRNQSNQNVLYTSGYEGFDIQGFIDHLKEHNIEYLIDIREKPISRKKGFSKKALEAKLTSEKINYLHFSDLGSPSEIRKKLRDDKDYFYFFKKFSEHLSAQQKSLEELWEVIQDSICCLLCFEKDHETCHRKIVAKEVLEMNNKKMLLKHL